MQTALIAGGSKGIGFAIAEALAKRKYNLVLIARDEKVLQNAKTLFEDRYKIQVEILSQDLSLHDSAKHVFNFCLSKNLNIDILCNVAGLGGAKDFLAVPLSETRYMIHLNVESVVALTHELLPLLRKSEHAHILNVASMGGFAPIPVKNAYSATKSAVILFSRGLRSQLKKENINVSCLCPGPVFTKPEIEKDTIEKMGWFGKQMAVPAERVGEIAVKRTLQKKFMIIPGFLTTMVSVFVRILPDALLVNIYEGMIERSQKKK